MQGIDLAPTEVQEALRGAIDAASPLADLLPLAFHRCEAGNFEAECEIAPVQVFFCPALCSFGSRGELKLAMSGALRARAGGEGLSDDAAVDTLLASSAFLAPCALEDGGPGAVRHYIRGEWSNAIATTENPAEANLGRVALAPAGPTGAVDAVWSLRAIAKGEPLVVWDAGGANTAVGAYLPGGRGGRSHLANVSSPRFRELFKLSSPGGAALPAAAPAAAPEDATFEDLSGNSDRGGCSANFQGGGHRTGPF